MRGMRQWVSLTGLAWLAAALESAELGEDYILTAKAKGMTDGRILRDHALKNAMLPVVTIIALTLGFTGFLAEAAYVAPAYA